MTVKSIRNFKEAVEYIKETMPEYAETTEEKRQYIKWCVGVMYVYGFETCSYDIMVELGYK